MIEGHGPLRLEKEKKKKRKENGKREEDSPLRSRAKHSM